MSKKSYIITAIIIVFTCGVLAGIFNMFSGKNKMYYTATNNNNLLVNEETKVDPRFLFAAIKLIIDKNYVEKIDAKLADEMSVDLAKGMLRELGDQSCRYIDKKEMTEIDNASQGIFEGIGIKTDIKPINVKGINEEKLYVSSVVPGGPAYNAGIKSGEMIISVDNKEILPYNPLAKAEKILKDFEAKPDRSKIKEIQQKLNEENDRIEAGIPILEAEKIISFKSDKNIILKTNNKIYNLKPDKWTLKPVRKEVYKGITYLSIQCITDKTGDDLGDYIIECINNKQNYFVLDLRDVFGGTYSGAKNIAKWFVPNTNLGTLKTKKGKITLSVSDNDIVWRDGLVILVNKGTSKYGELLANAISQHKTAVIIGEETQGDFKDISVYDFNNGGGFTLTTGEYIPFNNIKKVIPNIKANVGLNGKEIDTLLIKNAMKQVGM